MRRLTISLGLLVLLAGLGLWNCARLEQVSGDIAATLTQAQSLAEEGRWEEAELLTRKAQADWEDAGLYLYIVLCHNYTDEVSAGFQEVLALLRWREAPEYTAASQSLLAQVTHFSEAEQLNWKNLL
ncbi:MAG: DUF4363 family protein [Candidatus Onthomonas sp.]